MTARAEWLHLGSVSTALMRNRSHVGERSLPPESSLTSRESKINTLDAAESDGHKLCAHLDSHLERKPNEGGGGDVSGRRVILVTRKPGNKSNPPCAVGLPADFVWILLQEPQVF